VPAPSTSGSAATRRKPVNQTPRPKTGTTRSVTNLTLPLNHRGQQTEKPVDLTRRECCGLQFLDEASLAHLVEHYEEESQITLPRFISEGRSFDMAFVDGNHRFDGVFLDLVYLGRLVRAGGIVFLDDYQLPAVARSVSFCLTNLGWGLEQVSAADDLHQWAVLRTSDVPDTRPFDYYIGF
jgi:hypothetical protein